MTFMLLTFLVSLDISILDVLLGCKEEKRKENWSRITFDIGLIPKLWKLQLYQKLVLGCWCQFYFVLFLFYYFWFLGSHTFSSLSYFVDEPNQETSNAVASHIHMNICVHFQLCWICFSCRNYSVFHGYQFCISRCYKNSPFLCQETDWVAFSLIYYPR